MSETSREPGRADARRNYDAVVAAALRLLTDDPGASMRQIADASGLTRTTVYRHFPSREELLRAIFRVVAAEIDAAMEQATAGDPPLEQVMAAIARMSFALDRRFRFLIGHDALAGEEAQQAGEAATLRWLDGARARGEVRDDMPASWQVLMLRQAAMGAVETDRSGLLDAAEAERLLSLTLVALLTPPQS
ncbi:helix-turn-helix domain-containing protein [Conexibacter sp. JD483]|uniref:TetR/AcrR family transcriptional regulator n=1 Tax=unclassified Conexibacter TaxID=2627773 RepID=UPI00271CBEE9|nr:MULTISPECIES: TetR/AcrR family transcriptional regulator [unclassified Conexibacter]MDO8186801.1 helix-turn-helix domain-containing protein [Conexibacter sp. CPCC 205706]MDO8197445.1 helix-turn-helix domain-containing protein [Conexibacter sp. CPCC 205762]MDR9370460.1 helix-turn-helix domain-containing protein [Conexibacter sp. JD483]